MFVSKLPDFNDDESECHNYSLLILSSTIWI